jgi:hypothetical protein
MLAAERFRRLLAELSPTADERAVVARAQKTVRHILQAHYYGPLTLHDPTRVIGAWAKRTEVRPIRALDLLFVLPRAVRDQMAPPVAAAPTRFAEDVRLVLGAACGDGAHVRADGRAVLASVHGLQIDVYPARALERGRFQLQAGDGGTVTVEPALEESMLDRSDAASAGNTRDLIRMLKCWQAFRRVPLSSFALELLAIEFLATWAKAGSATSFYDWMIRDFFLYLVQQTDRVLPIPGADDVLSIGNAWAGPARIAGTHASKACDAESAGLNADAWWEWEKIFGERIPLEA